MNNVSTKNVGVVLHAVMKRCGFYSYTCIVGEGEGLNESQRFENAVAPSADSGARLAWGPFNLMTEGSHLAEESGRR